MELLGWKKLERAPVCVVKLWFNNSGWQDKLKLFIFNWLERWLSG
jgi:hypothetical protein